MTPNFLAFCEVLAHSEGTISEPDPYRVCFGKHHTIVDLSDHPSVTGEWMGEHWAGGLSTAAGKYQINKPSWLDGKAAAHLSDFDGDSQDAWVAWKLSSRGILELVDAGQAQEAISRSAGIWASLPGGNSGQPEKSFAELLGVYAGAGGAYA